ncbi:hypothetical protein [Luedemannella helvata]|uniref:Uncharacterized protein n=1 Tax=Luedemannella helvata TaxID=349315 RepID=A0ABP4X7Q5_9ACTN
MRIRSSYLGLATAILVLAGCAQPTPASPGPDASVDPPVTTRPGIDPACGQPFGERPGDGLTMTGKFPATATADQRTLAGTVTVTSSVTVKGVVGRTADVYVVHDGRVVVVPGMRDAVGVVWELTPGATKSLPAEALLAPCDGTGDRLAPGTYAVYATVVLFADDGTEIRAVGGPWPLDVR